MKLLRQLGLSGGGRFFADDEQYSGSRRGERFGHAGVGADERTEVAYLAGVGDHVVDGQQPADSTVSTAA